MWKELEGIVGSWKISCLSSLRGNLIGHSSSLFKRLINLRYALLISLYLHILFLRSIGFPANFFFLPPQQFLKEILNELCVYNKRGTNQGTYELKPEYKKSVEDTGAEQWLCIVHILDCELREIMFHKKEKRSPIFNAIHHLDMEMFLDPLSL